MGGIAFFLREEPGSGFQLWRTDGTDAGTFRLPPADLGVLIARGLRRPARLRRLG